MSAIDSLRLVWGSCRYIDIVFASALADDVERWRHEF